jgi:uncharacterized Fe-S cluster protein YjdI
MQLSVNKMKQDRSQQTNSRQEKHTSAKKALPEKRVCVSFNLRLKYKNEILRSLTWGNVDAIWQKRVVSWLFVFCVDSHQDPVRLCFIQHDNNYRGNVMDKELLDAGYRAYTGEKIDVYFNTGICKHSGNCVRGSAKLFNLKRKPWIIPMKWTLKRLFA